MGAGFGMKIRTKHPAVCPKCHTRYEAGATMVYDHRRGITHCLGCWIKEIQGGDLTAPSEPAKVMTVEPTSTT